MPSPPSYRSTLRYLYGLQTRGMKFGLRNIRALTAEAGHPERRFPSIHIAGTNGKGSTASFLASIFQEAGYVTGLYTSPHLVDFTERIRINGKAIPEKRLVEYVRRLQPAVERHHATFFEATTCVAFEYFADEDVDIAIIETGLGGRLDATNTLKPLASVITEIGLDHMDLLGNTLRSIAREKGGIIKPGIPVVTSTTEPEALSELRRIARRRHAGFTSSAGVHPKLSGAQTLQFPTKRFGTVKAILPLRGEHQHRNAALVVTVLDILGARREFRELFPAISAKTIAKGFARVCENTLLRGRGETYGPSDKYTMDVAHNPAGMSAIVAEKKHYSVVVFGVMRDKDFRSMLAILRQISDRLIAVRPSIRRSLPLNVLLQEARRAGFQVKRGGTVGQGMALARRTAGARGKILITGSFYVAGEALQWFKKKT